MYNHCISTGTSFIQLQVEDIENEQEQEDIIIRTQNRAYRNCRENKLEIIERFYFPAMARKIKKIVKQSLICRESKYYRRPIKPEIKKTPIPIHPGHTLHIDLHKTDNSFNCN